MIRIDDKTRCCGCGGCANVCPVECIAMRADEEGFLYPVVDADRCVQCGRCEQVCPILRADGGARGMEPGWDSPKAVGGWHRDAAVRQASSSGGAFTLLAGEILRRGGVVFGAAMNGLTVEHTSADCEAGLAAMRGSKYVQSAMGDAYRRVRECLKAGRPVLFSGTPCQTAGLTTFLGKRDENLYTVDFICHGVPSPKVFRAYLDSVERQSNAKVTAFSFREKDHGWHPSGLQLGTRAKLSDGREIRRYPALRDSYMNGFLEDIFLRPSCYECRFKTIPKWSADFTIADFWGVDKALPEMNDGKGTSLILIHNERAMRLFERVKDAFEYRECDWQRATVKNPTLVRSAKLTPDRERFFESLESDGYDRTARRFMTTGKTVVRKASKLIGARLNGLIRTGIATVGKVLRRDMTEAAIDRASQFIKFCMVGVSNVLVSYAVNISTLFLLSKICPGFRYDYVVANTTAFLLSVYWSFFWNSRKVFHLTTSDRKQRRKALLKTYMCYGLTGIVLNNVLSTIWIQGLGISKLISPLINLFFTIPVNYLTNKYWAFADKNGGKQSPDQK